MKKRLIILLLIPLLMAAECRHNQPDPIVLSDSTPQLSVQGKVLFRFEENTCQLGYNRERAEFRMHTDNMSDYVLVNLDHIPSSVGEEVTAEEISWTTAYDIEYRMKIILEVLKLEDGNIWLWSSRDQMALVVRELE